MKLHKYDVEVVFSTPVTVTVQAEDEEDAMAEAEYQAQRVFATMMAEGSLYPRDFDCNAQCP